MTILAETDARHLPEGSRESLSIELDFGGWILNGERVEFDQQIERWFRIWLETALATGDGAAFGKDEATKIAAAANQLIDAVFPGELASFPKFSPQQVKVVPVLILTSVNTGSAISNYIVGVAAGLTVAIPVSLYPGPTRHFLETAYIDTVSVVTEFVKSVEQFNRLIVEGKPPSREVIPCAWHIYNRLARIKNGSMTITVHYPGREDYSIKITSEQAVACLPIISRNIVIHK